MRRTLALVLLLVASTRGQESLEIEPVTGFQAEGCLDDLCGNVPVPFGNAMLMAPKEWMVTVRVERSRFIGTLDGHKELGVAEVLGQGYTMAPRDMTMDMTMVEAMVGLDEDTTFMAMLPWMDSRMEMVMDDGTDFDMDSSGMGDLALGLTTRAWEGAGERLVFHGGVSLPTGSVNEKDDMPGFPNSTVDYVMQPGSGTFDLRPALTWLAARGDWRLGAQFGLVQRLGQNSQDWQAPNHQDLSLWAARLLADGSSWSGRLTARRWGRVHGADDNLDPAMSPTQDPDLQAGRRIEAALGWRRGSFVTEVGAPLSEKLDGPQLSLDWFATVGWQFAF